MTPELSRRRFLAGCGVAGTSALAAGAAAEGVPGTGATDRGAMQPPPTTWNRTFQRGIDDEIHAVVPAVDGSGYVVAGSTSSGEESSEAWLFKVDGTGDQVWEQTYSERAVTVARDVAATGDGYVLAGYTSESSGSNQSGLAVRVGPQGGEQWRTTADFSLGTTDVFEAADQDPDGQYVLAGRTSRLDSGWIVRLDSDGSELLNEHYQEGRANHFYDVRYHERHGGYVAIGETDSTEGPIKGWVLKVDGDGVPQWTEAYGLGSGPTADGYNVFRSFVEVANGFVVVGANAESAGAEERNGWVFGMTHFGGRSWTNRISGRDYTELHGLAKGNLEYYLAGVTADDPSGGDSDGFLSLVGIEGGVQWTTQYEGDGADAFADVLRTDAEGLVPVGRTANAAGGSSAGWAVKAGGRGAPTPTPTQPPATPTQPPSTPTQRPPTPTPTDSPTPTPTVTPRPATPTPTDAPAGPTPTPGGGGPGGTEAPPPTTAGEPGGGGGGGISTTLLVGAAVVVLGVGALLYNQFAGGGPDEGTGGQPPAGQGGQPPAGQGGQPGGGQPPAGQAGQPQSGQGGQPPGGQGGQGAPPQGGQGPPAQGAQGGQPQGGQPQAGQGGQPQGGQPQSGQGGQPPAGQAGQPQGGQTQGGGAPEGSAESGDELPEGWHQPGSEDGPTDPGAADGDAGGDGSGAGGDAGDADASGDSTEASSDATDADGDAGGDSPDASGDGTEAGGDSPDADGDASGDSPETDGDDEPTEK